MLKEITTAKKKTKKNSKRSQEIKVMAGDRLRAQENAICAKFAFDWLHIRGNIFSSITEHNEGKLTHFKITVNIN